MARPKDTIYDPETAPPPPRDGVANALVVLTTLALLGGLFCIEKAKQKHFDTGVFGKTKGAPNVENLVDRSLKDLADKPQ